ncbi:hypothetical protein BOX15_Mlig013307g4 [Macrostomum lignano]|uniref:Uncharacterized protein n=1 Tax=Macrostomum lignano TaxID=282301 RepID=A0A267GJL6_9PLAT|nr:hypothetical protein BOX15_Mlig013307g4 [Macrostomum lignano]
MATYGDPHFDGFPSIHRHRVREGWRTDDLTRDSLNFQNRSLSDLQEQVRLHKEELRRKDDLIRELQSMDAVCQDHERHYSSVAAAASQPAANACPTARSDLAAMQTRLDNLIGRLRDRDLQLDAASETIRDLRSQLAQLKSSQETQSEDARKRAEFPLRVRRALATTSVLAEDLDGLVNKVSELVKENVDMKAQIHTLTDQQATMELAAAANKQTIERLLAEVNKEYRAAFQLGFTEAEFKTETDKLKEENEQLTKKAELLEIQLNAEKATVETVKADLSEKEAQLSKLDCEKREAAHSSETLGKQLAGFVDSLATMLGTAYNRVPSTEEAVREKVRQLLADIRNHSAAMAGLEERVKTVTGQLGQQLEANRKREERGVAAEGEAKELRDKLRAVEAQLAAGDVIRESLRGDKDRLYQYLKRLGQALSMEASAIDVAYDVLGEGLVERAEQLVRQGGGCCGCDNGGGLRRRVDSLKEQLESKDLHLELMRRRLAQLDGSGAAAPSGGVADLERERARQAERRLEKAHRMLEDARREADDLRAQLSGFGELRAAASRQDRDLEQLEAALDKLERVRQKQAQRIASLKTQLAECRRDSDESLRCLSEELRVARQELDEAVARERRLAELRASVSRLVLAAGDSGDDASILARLQQLLWHRQQQPQPPLHHQQPQFQQHYGSQQLHCSTAGAWGDCQRSCGCGGGGCCDGGGGGCDCDCGARRGRGSKRRHGGARSASCGPEYRRY